ncbi:hypothetical protein F4604DRAFT_1532960, partial [Suillus subluteus]
LGATVRRNCYELFKAAYPDTWQTILEYHGQSVMLSGVPQTIAMRAQEFQKYCRKIIAVMDGGAARFGFESAFVTCSKVVNQDGGLGQIHTTPGAGGFWLSRCKADDDTIIGHLKAHVYVTHQLLYPTPSIYPRTEQSGSRQRSLANSVHFSISSCSYLLSLGGKFLSSKKFPWNTLPAELTRQGMMITGYPEDVLLPGEYHASKSKGIANLTLKEAGEVIAALKAGTMCLKKVSEDMQAMILTSELPVVEGARPPADSLHTSGRRLFANGQSDRKGL